MRIIAGKYKGKVLRTFEADNIRPTSDMVKEAICSKLQFYFPESVVLDLFGGTGNFGFEALSRGADNVYICDNNDKSIAIINLNQQLLKSNANIMQGDYNKCIKNLSNKGISFERSSGRSARRARRSRDRPAPGRRGAAWSQSGTADSSRSPSPIQKIVQRAQKRSVKSDDSEVGERTARLHAQQADALHARNRANLLTQRILRARGNLVHVHDGHGHCAAGAVDQVGNVQAKTRDGGGDGAQHVRDVLMDAQKARLGDRRDVDGRQVHAVADDAGL